MPRMLIAKTEPGLRVVNRRNVGKRRSYTKRNSGWPKGGSKYAKITTGSRYAPIHIEQKCIDTPINTVVVQGGEVDLEGTYASGNSQLLFEVPRGTTSYQRIGNRVTLKKFQFNGTLSFGEKSPGLSELRVIFFIDMEPEASKPVAADLLDLKGGLSNDKSIDALRCFRKLSEINRFKILYDKLHFFNPSGRETFNLDDPAAQKYYPPKQVKIKCYKNLNNLQAIYQEEAAGGTYEECTQAAIMCMFLTDVEGSSLNIRVHAAARLRYTDL
ncbi:MAG: putative viral capsid protein [Cressdnaviricota sp.]|nr:MAG: putative viral capsid protein [Cressdnaviricota sp.]